MNQVWSSRAGLGFGGGPGGAGAGQAGADGAQEVVEEAPEVFDLITPASGLRSASD